MPRVLKCLLEKSQLASVIWNSLPSFEGQKVSFWWQIACSKSAQKIYHFIYPKILFHQIVHETLLISLNIVSFGKAMYQDAFFAIEFCIILAKGRWKCSGSAQMYHEILPPCTHAQKEITCSNASLHPSEQFYMHKNTSRSVFIVWELKELTESCQLLKKGAESALEVRRCTTKFCHLAHMRRRRSPVPMQVYIPVNSSICIRTLREVYSSCES